MEKLISGIQKMIENGATHKDLLIAIPKSLPGILDDFVQTPWGDIKVSVNPYLPKDTLYLVNGKVANDLANTLFRP